MIRARGAARRHAATWPGFVDAMTGLLLVLMFVLTIFTVVQFTLRDQISGQETQLNDLTAQVATLADALGLAEAEGQRLGQELDRADRNAEAQEALIAALAGERDEVAASLDAAGARIDDFEARVASLLTERDSARSEVADLQAGAASQADAAAEAATLAAARREALEALVRSLQNDTAEDGEALGEAEAARLADAAAADALRARLRDADAELTAMTLALEEERREAEETLTLLAAAEAAKDDLDTRLAAAILSRDEAREGQGTAAEERDALDARLLAALSVTERTQAELAAAREALAAAEAEGADLSTRLAAAVAAQELSAGNLAEAQAALEAALADDSTRADVEERLAAAVLAQEEAQAARASAEARAAEQASLAAAAEETAALLVQEQEDLSAELLSAMLRQEALERESQNLRDAAEAVSEEELRAELAAALERVAVAEAEGAEALTESERQAALLATANDQLAEEEALSAEGQRRVQALNEQVAALRSQVAGLQDLLGAAEVADVAADVQIESLGADLNAALARAAAAERERAELEAAERARAEADAQAARAEADDLETYRSEFFGNMRRLVEGREGIQVVGDRFVFSSEVLFEPARATLSAEGEAQIAQVSALLREIAGEVPPGIDWVIQVDGHTDDQPLSGAGEFRDNWELSQARALSVLRQMNEVEGIPPTRLSANGFGEFQPLDPADTPEARARNRRIEIKLTER